MTQDISHLVSKQVINLLLLMKKDVNYDELQLNLLNFSLNNYFDHFKYFYLFKKVF